MAGFTVDGGERWGEGREDAVTEEGRRDRSESEGRGMGEVCKLRGGEAWNASTMNRYGGESVSLKW